MTPLICEMVKVCPDAELFHWFDASQIAPDQRINLNVVNDTPLPYSRCAIAGVDGAAKWLIILGQEGDVVAYAGWTLDAGHYEKHIRHSPTPAPMPGCICTRSRMARSLTRMWREV